MKKVWCIASGALVATALTFSVGSTAWVQADDDVPSDPNDPGIMCYDYGTSVDSDIGNEFMVTDNTNIVCDIPQTTNVNEATDGIETGEGDIPNGNDGGGLTYGSYD